MAEGTAESPPGPSPEAGEPPKPYQRILKSKSFIPTVVVLGLICAILLSSRLAGRPPIVDSITPRRRRMRKYSPAYAA